MAAGRSSPRAVRHPRRPPKPRPPLQPYRPRCSLRLIVAAAVLAGLLWAYFALPDAHRCGQPTHPPQWSASSEAAAFAAIPASLRHPATGTAQHPDQYTVVVNSYRRPDLLTASVRHYANCRQVDVVRGLWSEEGPAPGGYSIAGVGHTRSAEDRQIGPDGVAHVAAPVVYDVQPNSSLNNRFRPLAGLRTEAVLSVDDDVLVPCDEVQATFAAWRRRPSALTGWFPRGVAPQRGCRGYDYLSRDRSVLLRGAYSIVLSKGAFLHRDYLQLYTAGMPAGVHRYVDAHRNCEDIAMAFLVANFTGAPPEYVRAPSLRDLGQGVFKVKGISSIGGHAAERTACVNEFTRLFGRMPLVHRELRTHSAPWRLRLSTLLDRAI